MFLRLPFGLPSFFALPIVFNYFLFLNSSNTSAYSGVKCTASKALSTEISPLSFNKSNGSTLTLEEIDPKEKTL